VGILEQAVAAGALAGGSAGRRRRRGGTEADAYDRSEQDRREPAHALHPMQSRTSTSTVHREPPSVCGSLLTVFRADKLPERADFWRRCQGVVKRNSGLGNPMRTKPTSFA